MSADTVLACIFAALGIAGAAYELSCWNWRDLLDAPSGRSSGDVPCSAQGGEDSALVLYPEVGAR